MRQSSIEETSPHSLKDSGQAHHALPPVPTITRTSQDIGKGPPTAKKKKSMSPQIVDDRDTGISDEVLNQLQADKQAADLALEPVTRLGTLMRCEARSQITTWDML
jgi:hypothetical protein